MRIKYTLIVFSCLFVNIYIFSESNLIKDYNDRAYNTFSYDPSNSLYYCDRSLELNGNITQEIEYIKSNYIKSLSYKILDESFLQNKYINIAMSYLTDKKINYTNDDFYLFYIDTLYNAGSYSELFNFFNNKNYSYAMEESEIKEKLYKIKLDNVMNNPVNLEDITDLLKINIVKETPNLLSEVYLVYGDIIFNSSVKEAHRYYIKSTESLNTYYAGISYYRLGKQLNNINYLVESYLILELFDDKDITVEVLQELVRLYKSKSDFKNSTLTLETINYIEKNRNNFLLVQNKKIEKFNFTNEQLTNLLDKKSSQLDIYLIAIISLGAAVLILLIIVSILTYKIRGLNI